MYSVTYRKVYNNIDKITDKEYIKKLKSEEPLLKLETLNSIEKEVNRELKIYETQQNQIRERIDGYNEEIDELRTKPKSKANDRKIFWLDKKVIKNWKQIGKKPVFGSKLLAREMTYNKNMFRKTGEEKFEIIFKEKKEQWKEQRLRNFYSVGNSLHRGNIFFDFDFNNNKIIFKPNVRTKINIIIKPTKSQKKELEQVQTLIDSKEIPITVYLSSDKISITYSSERLNNFDFKENDCKKEKINKSDEEKKLIWIKYKKDQEQRKMSGKLPYVYCGIDLNPEYIGVAIRNKTKILFTKCYDLKSILENTKDNNTETIRYNLAHIYKDIFSICSHYKVSHFTTEKLSFEHDESQSKSFNRKTKNLWCREFQVELIQKYTERLGITHIEINPAYSSFVGNMLYECFDPVAASLEICRRGMIKYKKVLIESWYPDTKGFRLSSFGMHVSDLEIRDLTVQAVYQLFKSRNQSYRRSQSVSERDSKSKLILTRTFQNSCKNLL